MFCSSATKALVGAGSEVWGLGKGVAEYGDRDEIESPVDRVLLVRWVEQVRWVVTTDRSSSRLSS